MDELVFVKKKSGRGDKDITLNTIVAHAERNERRISITFRNGIEKLITLDKEPYAIVAVLGKRIYFKKASSIEGFKISGNKGNKGY